MKILSNRKFAAVIMVIVLVISLFGGTVYSVNKKLNKTMALYYSANDGYGDVKTYFTASQDCARSLLKLAENVGVSKDFLDTYKDYIKYSEKAETPADKYSAMQKLFLETETLYEHAKTKELDKTDSETLARLYFEITGNAQRVSNVTSIRRDMYNEEADKFNKKVLGSFPLKMYYSLLGIEKLEKIY